MNRAIPVLAFLLLMPVASAQASAIVLDPSDSFDFARIEWTLAAGTEGILPKATTIGFDTTNDLFTSFTVKWKDVTFDLLEGDVYQSVSVLPHGPAEFYNALFTGGTWSIQRDVQSLYYLVLQPSYGDRIDTAYVSAPLIRPETTTLVYGTFAVTPARVPEPSTIALLVTAGVAARFGRAFRTRLRR